jgi:hypothetical protein
MIYYNGCPCNYTKKPKTPVIVIFPNVSCLVLLW